MFAYLEEKLTTTVRGLNALFYELYQIRHERILRRMQVAERFLQEKDSTLATMEYLSVIFAMAHGGAVSLNSSFYQRFVSGAKDLKHSLIHQALLLPTLYPKIPTPTVEVITTPKESPIPKLIKPLTPPMV